jgi:hypothetical protein
MKLPSLAGAAVWTLLATCAAGQLAGCTSEASPEAVGTVDGPVLTVGPAREVAVMDAILAGRITLDIASGCLGLDLGDGQDPAPIVWPNGTRWQADPARIILPDDREIRVGEGVSAGGGYVPPENVEAVAGVDVRREAERCASNGDNVAFLQAGFVSGE